jgi:hypothetical protein
VSSSSMASSLSARRIRSWKLIRFCLALAHAGRGRELGSQGARVWSYRTGSGKGGSWDFPAGGLPFEDWDFPAGGLPFEVPGDDCATTGGDE